MIDASVVRSKVTTLSAEIQALGTAAEASQALMLANQFIAAELRALQPATTAELLAAKDALIASKDAALQTLTADRDRLATELATATAEAAPVDAVKPG